MRRKSILVKGMRVGEEKKHTRKENESRYPLHTLDAPDYKAHVPFLRKLKEYKCALRSEKYGNSKKRVYLCL